MTPKLHAEMLELGLSPLPVRVTTRIITFLVGNPYKPSFPLLLGGGTTQGRTHFRESAMNEDLTTRDYQNCILNHHEFFKWPFQQKYTFNLPVFFYMFLPEKNRQLLGFFCCGSFPKTQISGFRFVPSVSPTGASQSHQTDQQLPDRRTKCPGLGS